MNSTTWQIHPKGNMYTHIFCDEIFEFSLDSLSPPLNKDCREDNGLGQKEKGGTIQ